ncbi:DUF7710 domain-containing protein [Micromonospora phaseoli]|uniref:DUF7710 domain-containing protein n=1 Tax=Micromonospora phaseoli TaxID=1144548 RepID=UPI003FD73F51
MSSGEDSEFIAQASSPARSRSRRGGAYDVAVSEGRFTPSKAHHGTSDRVAAFGPGLHHIHLTGGRRD